MRFPTVAVLLAFCGIGFAQLIPLPWENQYNYQEYDFAADICAAFGGGAIVVGGDWESIYHDDMRTRISKLNGAGIQQWSIWSDFSNHYPVFEGVCRNEDDETYAVVGTHDWPTCDREMILAEYSSSGTLIRSILHDDFENGRDIIRLDDGSYVVYASRYNYGCVPYLMRTDYQFNQTWLQDILVGIESEFLLNDLPPGNAMCTSRSGEQIITGYTYMIQSMGNPWLSGSKVVAVSTDDGAIVASYSPPDWSQQFIGVDLYLPPRPYTPGYVVMGNPITTQSMEGIFQHTDEYISITVLDESLDYLAEYEIDPPSPFDGIRVYDFERFSSGYMVSGMVRDGDDWHMWIGRLDNNFVLTHSFVGSSDTGSFGLIAASCDQMGGCVTEAGHFFAAGAAYLSSGHTNYDVMYRPFFPENLSDGSEVTAGIPLPASEAGLSVTRVSISGQFVFRYHGDDAEAAGAEVFDITGRSVRTLNGVQTSTEEVCFDFDGRGNDGNPLPSGAYVVTASTAQSFDSATFAIVR